jgi:peroxidase
MKPTNRTIAVALWAVAVLALGHVRGAVADDRSIDGEGNNETNTLWGSAGTQLLRKSPAVYPDTGSGLTMISEPARPNPREISNTIFDQLLNMPNSRHMTNGVWQWGQFVDHDIDLTRTNAAETTMLMTPPGDPAGMAMIPFSRSVYDGTTGTDGDHPRQQINSITSYLDGSVVYGSDTDRALALRAGTGGRLRMGANNLLPLVSDYVTPDVAPFMDDGMTGNDMFVAGDIRANEQIGLTSMQTLFAREHNRLADTLAANHAGDVSWDDNRIYNMARKIVGAEIQAITYNEFLPALLGNYAPKAQDYSYDGSIDASITTEFSTGIYRFGHTMLSNNLMVADSGGTVLDTMPLADAFFRPDHILDDPTLIDHVLMGLCSSQSQEIDAKMVDGVRNMLFAQGSPVGIDLASLNIQRGRDHGLPDYNSVRVAYGLDSYTGFDQITDDLALQTALADLYDNDIDNVDMWVGALAEKHVEGTSVGELVLAGLMDQFERLRDGDRFFYEGDSALQTEEVQALVDLDSFTFMDLMVWNTDLSNMPASFFIAAVPEPSTGTLILLGAAAAFWVNRRRAGCRAKRGDDRSR